MASDTHIGARDLDASKLLVTGASSGIGAEIARQAAASGAEVTLHCHAHRAEAEQLASELRSGGARVHVLSADLGDRQSWKRLVDDAAGAMGGLNGLVNNAGAPLHTPMADMTPERWDQVFALNVHAPFFLAQQAFQHMTAAGGGRIVNISSIGVKYGGSATTVAYAAAKSALEAVTLSLAKAGAPLDILVNAVRPGVIDTPAWSGASREEFAARVAKIPLKRAGTPGEVAALVRFLLSPAASYITGQVIGATGGD